MTNTSKTIETFFKLKLILIFCIFTSCAKHSDIKFSGKTSYSSSSSKEMKTALDMNIKVKIKNINSFSSIYLFGIIIPDYDHFGKVLKINAVNGISIDF